MNTREAQFSFTRAVLTSFFEEGRVIFWCALLLGTLLAVPAMAGEVVDQTGKTVDVPDKARRIVTMAPNITEMVFALGAGDAVVGCSQHSDYPPETKSLPRVGSYFRPDLERILALRPDLCLAVKDGTPAIVLKRLEELGIPVFIVNPQSLVDLREALLLLGIAIDRPDEAERMVLDMDDRIKRVDAMVAEHISQQGRGPKVLVRVQPKPFLAAARGTYPAELVERSGGRILLQGGVMYPRLSAEDLYALDPDLIVAPEGEETTPEGLPGTVHSFPVYTVPRDLIFRPSPRSLEVLDMLVTLFWQQGSPAAALEKGVR